ncbi:MAG: heme lyase CcmF/NrfE family subunit [Pseudomonadota bacterium]|nr:heme lyase CcmF/NrfE family subunit [Pseudomonadota bacterium]
MSAELGHFLLMTGLVIALLQAILPAFGVLRRQMLWQLLAPSLALAQFMALFTALVCLALAFLNNDFSLIYVAGHSNSLLPWYYQLSAVWGGHEGSLLLWVTILAGWCAAVSIWSKGLPLDMRARVLSILGAVQFGMLSFVVFTSSPFEHSLPMLPVDGRDLNPLLQDFGLIVHPPTLYMGYVGLAVPFAFAMAALWAGRLDSAWARWSRPWTLAAWAFLTVGIGLGSWWAYYELGWGGWWFWDPVENASFMPWLAATALIHSLAVCEKRGVFKAWTVMLAILAFALSLLGTFLVRSGVITSVHSFAADPTRGLFILSILGVVVGVGLLMFALRGWRLTAESRYAVWSRETLLVVNNVILLVATSVVLIGTLYPLIADAFKLGQVSVGAPYFNALFAPLTWLILVFMAVGPVAQWKQQRKPLWGAMLKVLLTSLLVGIGLAVWLSGQTAWMVMLTAVLCCWVLGFLLWDIQQKLRHAPNVWQGLKRLKPSYWGMQVAHFGLLMLVLGVSLTTHTSIERDVALAPNQSVQLADYEFRFDEARQVRGSNYDSTKAVISVWRDGRQITTLYPEKRFYIIQRQPMTEVAIHGSFWRDLYVAMGEPLDANNPQGAWAVRVYYKPFIRWLWLGALLMALGAVLSMFDRRYRLNQRGQTTQQEVV